MISEKKAANAMAGKTARACDSCLRVRARWFCAADDAFLCQSCDASVHTANQLAGRHQRVRLQTSSFKGSKLGVWDDKSSSPAWLRGFTRRARTPRNRAATKQVKKDEEEMNHHHHHHRREPLLPLVPEMSNEGEEYNRDDDIDQLLNYDGANEDQDEQLLYRVPIFDPFAAELCNPMSIGDDDIDDHDRCDDQMTESTVADEDHNDQHGTIMDDQHEVLGFLPSELELAEFAADVENLLGGGGGGGGSLEEDYSCDHEINGFGIMELLDCKEEEAADARVIKVEEEEDGMLMEASGIGFDGLSDEKFEYEELTLSGDQVAGGEGKMVNESMKKKKESEIVLRLNYEAVIAAWASQGSPWTTGTRPEVDPDHGWPHYMDMWQTNYSHNESKNLMTRGGKGSNNEVGGREARVSRYREKRRTRLFAKKIRYEVRKLNAEKRPRMKGRFVKRSSFMSTNNNQLMMTTK
ncbi:zinc finger protein CONSTANS-LIKE 6-like [Humulus lupulus]|uniref:zinc finger protein CONSTANS-LIKE 6-like n=1 Tax=Humulus lupulus TaxID=3486 RepID=UPI002B400C66|nr:zinc finger protein CONSTANS-LIKE 6-like [Humulus lupulus]